MNQLLSRLGQGLVSVFLLITLVFFLIRLVPGDPAMMLAGPDASVEQVELIRRQLGLDLPVFTQYLNYLGNLLVGDFGNSLQSRYSVLDVISPKIPPTLLLVGVGMALAGIFSLIGGIVAARLHNTWVDVAITTVAVGLTALPAFWIAIVLVNELSIKAGLLPSGGYGTFAHLILPAAVLATSQTGLLTRLVRSTVVETFGMTFMRTAQSKGISRLAVLTKHALRNSAVPVITVFGIQAGLLIGGAVVTETVFNWPGVGRLLIQSVSARDYTVLQGLIIVFGVAFILINLLVDLVNMWLDPRLRKS